MAEQAWFARGVGGHAANCKGDQSPGPGECAACLTYLGADKPLSFRYWRQR